MTNDTVPLPRPSEPAAKAPRRRRGAVIAGVIALLLGLAVAVAAVVGEFWLRDTIRSSIASEMRTAFDLADDQPVDVELAGFSVLLQAIGGRLDEVTISAENAEVEPFSGDLAIVATGVPVDENQPIDAVAATVTVSEDDVRRAGPGLVTEGFRGLELVDGIIRLETSFTLLTAELNFAIGIVPMVEDGFLRLTPTTASFNDGDDVDIDELLSQFGFIGDTISEATSVCVDGRLPEGLSLDAVVVTDDALILTVSGTDVALRGENAGRSGSCG